ncbi:MAG: hypothetical protein Q9215_008144 [Flavoplaca cf. flavocitrina]
MKNSWEMIYRPRFYEVEPDVETLEKETKYETFKVIALFDPTKSKPTISPLVLREGTRAVGSPSARAWLPTTLQPTSPESFQYVHPSAAYLPGTDKPNGCFEFIEFMKLLDTTRKEPLTFEVKGNWTKSVATGLPPSVLDMKKSPDSVHFLSLSHHLKVLDLKLALPLGGWFNGICPDLGLLQEFLSRARSLNTLRLSFPYDEETEYCGPAFNVTSVLPPITTLVLPNLSSLRLDLLKFSYRNLVGLLFHSLPGLVCLHLHKVQLSDGKWQDIIEGLRSLKMMRTCNFHRGLLYEYDEYYGYCERYGIYSGEQLDFLNENALYVLRKLARHPNHLNERHPDGASAKYLARLNETLKETRASQT